MTRSRSVFFRIIFFILIAIFLFACGSKPAPVEFEFVKTLVQPFGSPKKVFVGLQITRSGNTYYFPLSENPEHYYGFAEVLVSKDLDGDNEIEFGLSLLSCGAYCLTNFVIVYYDQETDQYLGTEPITRKINSVEDIHINEDSTTEFYTRNEWFTSLVGGATGVKFIGPIQILRFQGDKVIDITADYHELVQEDARYWMAHITNEPTKFSEIYTQVTAISQLQSGVQDDPEQEAYVQHLYLAAYMADMCTLGQCEEGWQVYYKFCSPMDEDDYCSKYAETIKEVLNDEIGENKPVH